MRKLGSKKRFALVASTTAAVLIGSGVAVAYWTTTGTGSGSATTGNSSVLTITQTNTLTPLYPGSPAQSINLNINNPSAGIQHVTTLSATITTDKGAACDASNFTFTPTTIGDVNPGATNAFPAAATIAMINKPATNQDACKSAVVTIAYSTV